jgi:FkbH-like protein
MRPSDTATVSTEIPAGRPAKRVKCVVWDLDDTVWDGTLLEGGFLGLRPGIPETIKGLDARGVLNSIASKNDYAAAIAKLEQAKLSDYFLYPQICWGPKSRSIERIAEQINIAMETIVFVDDQPFEREEVSAVLPQVRCIEAAQAANLVELLDLKDAPVTDESRTRRAMYQAADTRNRMEETFVGTSEMFLATLGMTVTIAPAEEADLDRAEELTVRTNQLNSTGRTYSRQQLATLCASPKHKLFVVSLDDKYGTYGRVGLALLELREALWHLRLLLMSCRVMSRGIGGIVLHHLMRQAKASNVRFTADLIQTDRNRVMLVTFRFAGFREIRRDGKYLLLEHDLAAIPLAPSYVAVVA